MQKLWRKLKSYVIPTTHNAYRPHLLEHRWLLFFLGVALAAESFLVANLIVRQTPDNFLAAVVASDIIALTNERRAEVEKTPVVENVTLSSAAQRKAEDMVAQGYFSHIGPDGKPPWEWFTEGGYEYRYAGENLAVRFIDSSEVVDAWMASPSHKANIVKASYTEIGVGIAQGVYKGAPATYVVQFFGAPPSTGAAVATAKVSSWSDTAIRQLGRIVSEPKHTTSWLLGAVAVTIISLLALAVLVRVHVQPTDLLAPGAVVAAVTLVLIGTNAVFLGTNASSQSASVATFETGGVVIGGGLQTEH